MSSSLTIEKRINLDHFKIWFGNFIAILNKYPELKKISSIKETIDVSKYFLAPMSRIIVKMIESHKDKKINEITNIYGSNKYNNLNYYHLDISKDYLGEYLNYTTNINNTIVFLEYLTFATGINFNKFNRFGNSKEIIDYLNDNTSNKSKSLFDIFIGYYVKIFPNVFVVLEINNDVSNLSNPSNQVIPTDLKNNLLYKKNIILSGDILSNIMFNLLQNYTYAQRLDNLQKINYNPNQNYSINFYIYETIGQIELYDIMKIESNIYVLFDKSSKIRFSSIFLNPNTIGMFENHHDLCTNIKIINNKMTVDKNSLLYLIYFQTLKKWIYNIYSGNELSQIIIGQNKLTNSNNPFHKMILIDNITNKMSKIKKINKDKIFFIDIIFLKSPQYKNILSNQKKIIETISNPLYYWELDGIKFMLETIQI
jgi:hypothetical protein